MGLYKKMLKTRFCNGCKKTKAVSCFSRNKWTSYGLCTQCKACMGENARRYYKANKAKVCKKLRIYNKNIGKYKSIEKRYGLTKELYLQMVKESKGKCTICTNSFKNKEPYVDHCHNTKIIRGLLCDNCNVGLSRFKDNCVSLERAKLYLQRSKL